MARMSLLGSFLHAYLGARWRFTRLGGEALARYQHRRAQAIVQYAIDHAPFYRAHLAGLDPAGWTQFPLVERSDLMGRFQDSNTRAIPLEPAWTLAHEAERSGNISATLDGVTVGLSSGTSGNRGVFLVSPQEQAAWAGFILARALPPLPLLNNRIALFLRANSNLYERLQSPLIRFRHIGLTSPIAQAVRVLNEYQPRFLAAPPSALERLADQQSAGHLRIHPERIFSVAEVLEPQDISTITAAFGCPLGQIYQATEGLLAITCPHGSLHLQEDLVAVQFEAPAMEGVAPDDSRLAGRCMPIITDLWRRTQPIIRYRLPDLLTLRSASCPCGSAFRVIERIEGRCSDLCHFQRRDGGLAAIFPEDLRTAVLGSHPAIQDYRVVQDHPGRFRVYLATSASDFPAAADSVGQFLDHWARTHGCLRPESSVERGIPELPVGGKRQRVRRC